MKSIFLFWHLPLSFVVLKADGGLDAIGNGGYGVGGVDDSKSNPNNPEHEESDGDGNDHSNPYDNIKLKKICLLL
jgi:hypothetical protein